MIIVCDKKALDPKMMGDLCRSNPLEEVYALPWVTNDKDLLVNLEGNSGRPNRVFPCENNIEPYEGEFREFDDSLGSDALGRMAHLVASGTNVVNEVMKCSCVSGFYGKVISKNNRGNAVFLVDCDKVDTYFPIEPLSAKLYAATTVPVRFANTEKFSDVSGCSDKMVDILIASDFIPGSVNFMGFYKVASGRDIVAAFDKSSHNIGKTPLFRYNKGYKLWTG